MTHRFQAERRGYPALVVPDNRGATKIALVVLTDVERGIRLSAGANLAALDVASLHSP